MKRAAVLSHWCWCRRLPQALAYRAIPHSICWARVNQDKISSALWIFNSPIQAYQQTKHEVFFYQNFCTPSTAKTARTDTGMNAVFADCAVSNVHKPGMKNAMQKVKLSSTAHKPLRDVEKEKSFRTITLEVLAALLSWKASTWWIPTWGVIWCTYLAISSVYFPVLFQHLNGSSII